MLVFCCELRKMRLNKELGKKIKKSIFFKHIMNKEYHKQYYIKNREKILKYRKDNKEKISKINNAWRSKNKDKIKNYNLKFKLKNKDYFLQYQQREKSKLYKKEYKLKNPHMQKSINAKRRAIKKLAIPKFANLQKIKEI